MTLKIRVSASCPRVPRKMVTSTARSTGELKLKLKVPRETFDVTARTDRQAFLAGDETSTTAIRTHYASSGFQSTAIIKKRCWIASTSRTTQREAAPRLGSLITAPALLAFVYFLYRGGTPPGAHQAIMITLP